MFAPSSSVLIVGAGAFGLSAAVELQTRGHQVRVLDPGPIPHPDASSTDISKVIRLDYGDDELYTRLAEDSLARWRRWNEEFGETVFHETGVLYLSRQPLTPDSFEHKSLAVVGRRGHPTERLDRAALAQRFPAWIAERYPDGYYNPQGGWSPSGRVVTLLARRARELGVELVEGAAFGELIEEGVRIVGLRTRSGDEHRGDWVVLAAGAWTPQLLPELANVIWPVAQPVMHFQPDSPEDFRPPAFPVWTADVEQTGWYGFPAQDDGALKVANHGPGWHMDPGGPRQMPPGTEERFRAFFGESLKAVAVAPKIYERLCFYCDTPDGDFWIDRHPEKPGLLISTGGSGHAFKFTPMLGVLTADALEGIPNSYAARFAWRDVTEYKKEAARHQGSKPRK